MAYHIKKQSVLLDSKTVYYKGDSTWTDTYADRKSYSTKTAANAEIANPSFFYFHRKGLDSHYSA